MFKRRLIVTIVGVPIVAAIVWFGAPWFTLLGIVWGIGAANEFWSIIRRVKGISSLTYAGLLFTVLLIVSPHIEKIPHMEGLEPAPLFLTAAAVFTLVMLLAKKEKEHAFFGWAWTMAGIIYIGWLLSYMVALRYIEDGRGWVFLAILCTFASDIFAYLTGTYFGKHKMAPYVSPKKSWEGSAGGLTGAIVLSVLVVYFFDLPLTYWQAVLIGALISAAGQCGDLVKSLFKRNMTVKDSGNVLPGHGGFLDRLDSIIFGGIVVYYFAMFVMSGSR